MVELYRACGYGTDPVRELSADLRDVEAMAQWAIDHQLSRVAFRIDYPDRQPPSGLSKEDVNAELHARVGGALKRIGFALLGESPARYLRIRERIPVEVALHTDEYANEVHVRITTSSRPSPRTFVRLMPATATGRALSIPST